jgi:hypothetical protein
MLMHPRLRLRYGRAWLTKRQGECPRGIVLVSKRAILPMVKIGRVGLNARRFDVTQYLQCNECLVAHNSAHSYVVRLNGLAVRVSTPPTAVAYPLQRILVGNSLRSNTK